MPESLQRLISSCSRYGALQERLHRGQRPADRWRAAGQSGEVGPRVLLQRGQRQRHPGPGPGSIVLQDGAVALHGRTAVASAVQRQAQVILIAQLGRGQRHGALQVGDLLLACGARERAAKIGLGQRSRHLGITLWQA